MGKCRCRPTSHKHTYKMYREQRSPSHQPMFYCIHRPVMKFALLLTFILYAEGRPRAPRLRAVHPNQLSHSATPFIVAGRNVTSKSRYPHMLSVRICGDVGCQHTCGAVILRADRGLTAAHCTDGRGGFQVAAGQLDQGDEEQLFAVSRTIEHQNYSSSTPGLPNDLSILVLASSLTIGGNVAVARLASAGQDFTTSECWSCGWGKLSGIGTNVPVRLQEIQMTVLNNSYCKFGMPDSLKENIRSSHICIWDFAGDGAGGICQGDSGGPLNCMVEGSWTVAGIVSWVVGGWLDTCQQEYPQIHTRVSSFLGWIADNIDERNPSVNFY